MFNSPYLRLYSKNSRLNLNEARLGLSVSKKSGNAVQRNIIKRIVRDCFINSDVRDLGSDILIIASPRLKQLFSEKPKQFVKEQVRASAEVLLKSFGESKLK